ncbi:MAG: flagellar motor protein MotB [Candidatus Riflebacteria bacterium]|nr:flagellar motor protein MotB [Candidatus Riflebacteria bacterium]
MSRRKKKGGAHENLERWLLTYADMITLLMAFFIMLYTMSRVDTTKLKAVADVMKGRLGYYPISFPGGGPSVLVAEGGAGHNGPLPISPSVNMVPYSDKTIMAHFSKYLKRDGLGDRVKVRQTERGVVLSLLSDGILFEKRESALKPEAKKILDSVGTLLAGLDNDIQVEGHTDESALSDKTQMNGNWILSAARAMAVLNYLVQQKYVPEKRINFAAFSSNKPVTNPELSDDEKRKLSRRVDLLIVGPQVRTNSQKEDFFPDQGQDSSSKTSSYR